MSGSHRHGWYYPHPHPTPTLHPNFLKWARLHVRFLTRWHKYPDPPTKLYCSSRCIAAEDDVKGISHTGHWARISVGESDAASASRGESVMANRIWAWLSNKQNVVIWFNKLWIILAAKNWNQSQFCVCLLVKFIKRFCRHFTKSMKRLFLRIGLHKNRMSVNLVWFHCSHAKSAFLSQSKTCSFGHIIDWKDCTRHRSAV